MQLVFRRLEVTYDDVSEDVVDADQSTEKCRQCMKSSGGARLSAAAVSGGLFQGCQTGDDVGAIPGLRQSLEEHFRAVNVAARICEIGIQCDCGPR